MRNEQHYYIVKLKATVLEQTAANISYHVLSLAMAYVQPTLCAHAVIREMEK